MTSLEEKIKLAISKKEEIVDSTEILNGKKDIVVNQGTNDIKEDIMDVSSKYNEAKDKIGINTSVQLPTSNVIASAEKQPKIKNHLGSPKEGLHDKIKGPKSPVRAIHSPTRQQGPTPAIATRLYNQAIARNKRLEEQRQVIPAECTFAPETNRPNSPASQNSAKKFQDLYQDSKIRQQKLLEKQNLAKESPEGCTFAPAVNKTKVIRGVHPNKGSNSTPPTKVGGVKRSELLYKQSKELQLKKEEMRKQKAENDIPSFKPKITRRARRAPSPGPAARMEQLYRSSEGKSKRREQERKSREVEGCTFSPKINRSRSVPRGRKASDGNSTTDSPGAARVQDRLNRYKEEVEKKREALRRKQRAEEDKELTFKPQVRSSRSRSRTRGKRAGDSNAGPDHGEIHSRLYSDAKRKDESVSQLRNKIDQESGLTFKPKITRRGRSASARRSKPEKESEQSNSSVFDRLTSQGKDVRKQHMKREEEKMLREMQECTFSPNIKQKSSSKREDTVDSVNAPVWERLSTKSNDIKKLREQIKVQHELEGCTFKPEIHSNPLVTDQKNTPRKKPSEETFRRLSESGKKTDKAKVYEKLKTKEELADCTFKPKVSTASKDMVFNKQPVWDRLTAKKELPVKALQVAKEVKKKKFSECTFQPKVNPNSVLILESPDKYNHSGVNSSSQATTSTQKPANPSVEALEKNSSSPKYMKATTPGSTKKNDSPFLQRVIQSQSVTKQGPNFLKNNKEALNVEVTNSTEPTTLLFENHDTPDQFETETFQSDSKIVDGAEENDQRMFDNSKPSTLEEKIAAAYIKMSNASADPANPPSVPTQSI